jgi:hypothetical protein
LTYYQSLSQQEQVALSGLDIHRQEIEVIPRVLADSQDKALILSCFPHIEPEVGLSRVDLPP